MGWAAVSGHLGGAGGSELDEALDLILSQGRALVASLAGSEDAERAERVNRMTDDELRAVAYAATAPRPS